MAGSLWAERVLHDARKASGIDDIGATAILHISGKKIADGLTARWTLSQDLASGRFAERADFDVFRVADVYDGTTRWRQDRSGGVHRLDGDFAVRDARTEAWLARRGYLKPDAEGASLTDVAEREDAGASVKVVGAEPAGGTPVELWFDDHTHLLSRVVRRRPIDTMTVRFADYRHVGRALMPFRLESEQGGIEEVVTVERYDRASPSYAGEFVAPTPPTDTQLQGATVVPIETEGYVVVDAMLNGKGPYGFILDTGGHAILTPAAAADLDLRPVGDGRSGGAGEGTLTEQDVRVASVKIGDARLTDQHFYVIPLQWATVERGERPPLAGIMGLELFERLAVRIDYQHRELTLAPFRLTNQLCRGTAVPITFDDDMPLVAGSVDGARGVVAIDTGNGSSTVVQGVWALRNGLGASMRRGHESVSFGSGGASRNWVSQGHTVAVGPQVLDGQEVRYAEDRKGAFSSVTEAANVGFHLLANFAVGFDYAGGKMCLESAAPFPAPPFNRAGVVLSKNDPTGFTVVQVRDASPAARAGLQMGDRVTSIDGRAATHWSGRQVAVVVRQAPGSRMRLEVMREGKPFSFEVVLEEPSFTR